ncbi:class I SAM-dependent methyltransferase [Sinosporangium siamense]|uniref:Methyltransferase n=1 Tax=Sinosporangium siamense TaxID=1367973 RepID=A0A919V994_9ACTN|nr:class I SAM-dependent methyltransferase [Sinosporangium siamense]GII94067.1 methyltransferase [Sinosporangium siamense]
MSYDDLVGEALTVPFEGWDFGVFRGRMIEESGALPWSYEEMVKERLPYAGSLLDLGTGGGELLASFAPLPEGTVATEGWAPNVPVARKRLEPMGVRVVEVGDDDRLPLPDRSFELVVSRHESYDLDELRRVLKPGGTFVTQQVGGADLAEINTALGAEPHEYAGWDLASAAAQLTEAGFEVSWRGEAKVATVFHDVGALVLFLRITPWHVPGFDVERYGDRLRALHEEMRAGRPLTAHAHRFALIARPVS